MLSQGSRQPGAAPDPPPAASWNMVQISVQTAQLHRPWLDIKAASLLEQPAHPSRLTPIPRQCLPLWCRLSLGEPPTVILPQNSPAAIPTRGSKRAASQKGCARFCRHAFFLSVKKFLIGQGFGAVASPHPCSQAPPAVSQEFGLSQTPKNPS